MASVNKKTTLRTHEGAIAVQLNAEELLMRSVLSCFLWEKEFYEDGQTIADRIRDVAKECSPKFVYELAMEARHVHGLRHVPLLLLLDLVARKDSLIPFGEEGDHIRVKQAVANVIRRADEITELLAMYWAGKEKSGRTVTKKLSDRQLRDGLGLAFDKFDEYALAKYNRDGDVKLKDALLLSHAKPKDENQAGIFKRLVDGELKTPDTWEVELSASKDKNASWTRLLKEGKLGYMALLRNLRNMDQAGVDPDMITGQILAKKGAELVLPFRYVAAARAAPRFEGALDAALLSTIKAQKILPGRTICLVDVSGSMDWALSSKSDLRRLDAAATLASVLNCEHLRMFTFSERVVEVPANRRGMAGVDAIIKSQPHMGTRLGRAVDEINQIPHDRLIVITDEQSQDRVNAPMARNPYMINVASNRNGIGYRDWVHLDGFSEGVIRFIHHYEDYLAITRDK